MSSMVDLKEEKDAIDDEDDNEQEKQERIKMKRERKSRSTSPAVVEFLNGYSTENKTSEKEYDSKNA